MNAIIKLTDTQIWEYRHDEMMVVATRQAMREGHIDTWSRELGEEIRVKDTW